MNMLVNLLKYIIRLIAEIGGYLLSVVMLILVVDIVTREFFQPLQGLAALSVLVAVTVVYMGIPHTEEVKMHVRVGVLTSLLSQKWKTIFNMFAYIIGLITFAIVSYAVARNAISSLNMNESIAGTTPFPIYPVKFIILFCCIVYWIQILINLTSELQKLKKTDK